jgi:hypothetical protein
MKRIVTLALLFYAATLCHADVPETLKMVAAHDGFTYDGIRHIQAGTAGYYCFVNGPREIWIPVSIKDDWSEIDLAWTVGVMSAYGTWTGTKAAK